MHARVSAASQLEQELLTIPDEMEPGRARIASENRRWLMSKWVPQTYGDKIDITVSAPPDIGAAMATGRSRVSRLSVSDQESAVDAQFTEVKQDSPEQHTDSESDAAQDPAFLALKDDEEEPYDPMKDPQFLALLE